VTLDFTSDTDKMLSSLGRLVPQQKKEKGEGACPRLSLYQAYLIAVRRRRDALGLAIEEGVAERCLVGPRPTMETNVQLKAERLWADAEIEAQEVLASIDGIAQRMERRNGSRVLLLASSGFFSVTPPVQREQERVIDSALRRGVVINSLDAKGIVAEWLGGPPAAPRPWRLNMRGSQASLSRALESNERDAVNDPLAGLARGTGGRFFTNSNDLAQGVRVLAAAPEVSYLVAFTPQNLKADGRFHKLEVKLGGRFADGHTVDARRGYYAPNAEEAQQTAFADKFDAAVVGSDSVQELTCEISAAPPGAPVAGTGGRESVLRLVIRVDVNGLPFQKREGRQQERLRVVTALFDVRERFVTGSEAQVDLALREESWKRLRSEGLEGEMELRVAPGRYRLRLAVQETVQGKMAAFSSVVDVR
jgi:VWFA-related protein